MLNNTEIQSLIPHRYPFLLVDKILELEPGKKAVGIKNVTANEPHFQGHFPEHAIMPGILIVEALAQTAGIAVSVNEKSESKLGVLSGIDGMKFKRKVVPGDALKLEAEILVSKLGLIKAKVTASVDGQTAAEGEIKIMMTDLNRK
ncbi:3-hydroxyacyl-ACP dehydratase FabZ [Desulfitobacterium sp. Sab5]|uniref:3-hydroxyacyl-ACP dehydratase FabZ n=1 Tax=Desulfitobacterium nosdiversum TaxID=3375356 RepID=UPI003CEBE7CF